MNQDRIKAGAIDCIVSYMFPCAVVFAIMAVSEQVRNSEIAMIILLIFFHLMTLLSRDFWSIGHKKYKLKVVDLSGKPATVRQKLIRNIFMILWGVEAKRMMNNKPRLGDLIANTTVVKIQPDGKKTGDGSLS